MDGWLTRKRGMLLMLLPSFLLAGTVVYYTRRPAPTPIAITPPPPTAAPTATSTPAPLRVYVSGAVRHPDVYELASGSIVKDAIVAAGGATEEANCERINLARSLHDEEHVYVPRRGETPPPIESDSSRPGPTGPVNVNTSSQTQLESLPGIGPALAQRIMAHRPYESVEDLLDVPGIGPATLENLRPLVTTRSP